MVAPEIESLLEDVKRFLPPYLSAGDKQELFTELRRLRESSNAINYYWLNPDDREALQGDIWKSFVIRKFDDGSSREVTGIVLSNSCDIDPANSPAPDQNVLFAPLLSLARYERSLGDSGRSESHIASELTNIRRQLRSDIFYLPAHSQLLPESLVLLDDVHPNPLGHFLKNRERRVAALSQVGHYIFLVKLSIHLTRLQENVRRRDPTATRNVSG